MMSQVFFFMMMALTLVFATTCPPANFTSKSEFNPTKFFNGTWYAIYQIEVQFQPESSFFCTTATYTLETECDETAVVVENRDTMGLNGPENTVTLQGIPSKTVASQAKVGPTFLPVASYGPYWVIEAGTFTELLNDTPFTCEEYEWAIISGGPPTVEVGTGCLPGIGSQDNTKGFWMFSRIPVPTPDAITKIMAIAREKGFDTTMWKPVVQEGCTYESDRRL